MPDARPAGRRPAEPAPAGGGKRRSLCRAAGRPAPRENLPRRETMQKLTAATVFAELQGKEIALIGLG